LSSELDIVLHGAEDDIVLQVHQYITNVLRMDFRDPACVGPAARLRLKLEIEQMIPARVASAMAEAAAEASAAFLTRCETEVAPILKDLAEKAARTSFSDWRTQHIRLMSMIYATVFLVIGGLCHAMIVGSFTLPDEVATYERNGNSVKWLEHCADSQFKEINGRAACNFVVYLEPPSQPFAYGPLADYHAIAQLLPYWLQWAVVGILACVALALCVVPFHPRIAIRNSAYVRWVSVLAGAALFVWLLSVIRPWP